jgi:hypothetical protein
MFRIKIRYYETSTSKCRYRNGEHNHLENDAQKLAAKGSTRQSKAQTR